MINRDAYMAQSRSYLTLEKLYDQVRRHIMLNGGDIQKFFMESDTNKDNYMSRQEMLQAFLKMGIQVSELEVGQVFEAFDENKDGRISYQELCK